MTRPGLERYRELYQPEDLPSSKPPPEPRGKNILKKSGVALAFIGVAAGAYYFYATQRGIGWFTASEKEIAVEKGRELVAVRQLVDEGRPDRALNIIRTLYKLNPDNVEYISTGAWVHFKLGQYRQALPLAETAVHLDASRARDHAILGATRFFFNQIDPAMESSIQAIQLDPELPLPYLTLGEIYLKKDDAAKALKALKQAGRLDTENPRVWNRLSSAFLRLNQLDNARLAAETALRLDPKSAAGHFNLAMILFKLEKGPQAVRHMQQSEDLYQQAGQTEWAGKSRQTKELMIRKFKLRPEDIVH